MNTQTSPNISGTLKWRCSNYSRAFIKKTIFSTDRILPSNKLPINKIKIIFTNYYINSNYLLQNKRKILFFEINTKHYIIMKKMIIIEDFTKIII